MSRRAPAALAFLLSAAAAVPARCSRESLTGSWSVRRSFTDGSTDCSIVVTANQVRTYTLALLNYAASESGRPTFQDVARSHSPEWLVYIRLKKNELYGGAERGLRSTGGAGATPWPPA